MSDARGEGEKRRPEAMTYTVLHAGTPLGTIEMRLGDEGIGVGLLVPRQPISSVVQELREAWTMIETLPDLPKYSSGPGRLSSKAASEARERVAAIANAVTLLDPTGRELHPTRVEYIHASGGTQAELLFSISFESDGSRAAARVPAPPTADHPGVRPPQ